MDSAELVASLQLSLPARTARSGSVAITKKGDRYAAGYVGSKTHLLDIPSELAALVRAVHSGNPILTSVETVVTETYTTPSPLVVKILIDHSARTDQTIAYHLYAQDGSTLLACSDVRELLPWYQSPGVVLPSALARVSVSPKATLDISKPLEMQLREWALVGRERNFPIREGASGYGASVLTADGTIYYGGQYSSFDNRLAVHAEMSVLLNALMDGAFNITHIGVASSKYPDTPCSACGPCRQFIGEFSSLYGFDPTFLFFASENGTYVSHSLEELLPLQWSDKK